MINPWDNFIKDLNNLLKINKPNFQEWKPIKLAINTDPQIHKKIISTFENSTTKLSNISHIFEFGAGLGTLASIIQPFNGSYTIFDFPTMIAIQAYNLRHFKINYISDINAIQKPQPNSLFIASSSIEESPTHIFDFFLNYAKYFSFFLFKFSGCKSKFENFASNYIVTINENFNDSTYIICGKITNSP